MTTPAANAPNRLGSIQRMRGVAALLVVIAHGIDVAIRHDDTVSVPALAQLGYFRDFGAIGVDLFFVISGFVMALSTSTLVGSQGAGRFLTLRWIRVAPPYLIATAAYMAIFYILDRTVPSVSSLWNAVLFIPALDTDRYTYPPIGVGWTLSFEVTFYLITAVTVMAVPRRARAQVLLAVLVILSVLGFAFRPDVYLLSWLTNPIYLEFAFGVGAYLLWRRGLVTKRHWWWTALGAAAAASLLLELFVGYGGSAGDEIFDGASGATRVFLWGIPSALILTALLPLKAAGSGLAGRVLQTLGDASYSIYLVHMLAFVPLEALLNRMPPTPAGDLVVLVAVLVGVGAGVLYYRLCERPVTEWLRRGYARRTGERPHLRPAPVVPPSD